MLDAFLDESDPGDRRTGHFVVAGYVGNRHSWRGISKLWDEILKLNPPLPYYKTNEYRNGMWTSKYGLTVEQGKARYRHFFNLLRDNETLLTSVCVDVNQSEFCRIVRDRHGAVPGILREPYHFCFHYFASTATYKIKELGIIGEQVDFVMDEADATTDRAVETFNGIRAIAHPWLKEMLGLPIPKSDRQTPALQAADMLAALFKDHCLDPANGETRKALADVSWPGSRNATKHISAMDLEDFMSAPSIAAIINRSPFGSTPTEPPPSC